MSKIEHLQKKIEELKNKDVWPEPSDTDWEELIVTEVGPKFDDGSQDVTLDENLGFFLPPSDIEPKIGMVARVYPPTYAGFPIRGCFLDGQKVYYRSEKDQAKISDLQLRADSERQKEDFKNKVAKLDERYEALPNVLKKRIDCFRKNAGAQWRMEHEDYELMICEQAELVANTLKTEEKMKEWESQSVAIQFQMIPGLSPAHSYNSMGVMKHLAYYLITDPWVVIFLHGALVNLVGCENYGCYHPRYPAWSKYWSEMWESKAVKSFHDAACVEKFQHDLYPHSSNPYNTMNFY